jgi:phosphoribosylaminoimidazole-succinocarboxamide synthase
MGKPGQKVPELTEDWIKEISKRYIELYELVTGEKFIPDHTGEKDTEIRILQALEKVREL